MQDLDPSNISPSLLNALCNIHMSFTLTSFFSTYLLIFTDLADGAATPSPTAAGTASPPPGHAVADREGRGGGGGGGRVGEDTSGGRGGDANDLKRRGDIEEIRAGRRTRATRRVFSDL
jgi:hypothetical protein